MQSLLQDKNGPKEHHVLHVNRTVQDKELKALQPQRRLLQWQ
jgi:hypothetical protein